MFHLDEINNFETDNIVALCGRKLYGGKIAINDSDGNFSWPVSNHKYLDSEYENVCSICLNVYLLKYKL